jgi:hypothetical protein
MKTLRYQVKLEGYATPPCNSQVRIFPENANVSLAGR